MENSNEKTPQRVHIDDIFSEYTIPSRVLRSFTNLSNTVIQTALSGQSKFVNEILQNADDAFVDRDQSIEVKFILIDKYFIVQHNGKGFDFNDVERICDYASQIEEVKAHDLSKTGYKGLGFKSLFNLSDCIYIYSDGYSFRFDKTYWSDSKIKPWQVIPIWCEFNELPFNDKISYVYPVNLILKVNNINLLENQLREIIQQPDLLIFLHRINCLCVNFQTEEYSLKRTAENFETFNKVSFFKNQTLVNTYLLKMYTETIPVELQTLIKGASNFIYPDKIKNSVNANFTFAVCVDETLKKISKIKGLCYSTLPTQLNLMLPYHTNSFFVLNLDRTQLHENEWNEFLMYTIGKLQFCLLRDIAEIPYIQKHVIELFVREINHPFPLFKKAFLKGFDEVKNKIGWLPPLQGSSLLRLGEAWIDDFAFFKENFQYVQDRKIEENLIKDDVISQNLLLPTEAKHFTFEKLLENFPKKYYHQLTKESYRDFIYYLYEKMKSASYGILEKLECTPFLRGKDGTLFCPISALLEESNNLIPDFISFNPVDNDYLPLNDNDSIKNWLVSLGAKRLIKPIDILRESILKWLGAGRLDLKINVKKHLEIINFFAKGDDSFTRGEIDMLKEKLLLLTESKRFKSAKLCYLLDAVSVSGIKDIISNDDKISSLYDLGLLKEFFLHVGVNEEICLIDFLHKNIFVWIKNNEIRNKLTLSNYGPTLEYIALHYPATEYMLNASEETLLKQIPVLTSTQNFQKADDCYFDTVLHTIKGLECAISKNKLVSTEGISDPLYRFLKKIGVKENVSPVEVMRKTIFSWLQEGEINNKITVDNHKWILEYIAKHWDSIYRHLEEEEEEILNEIPILTQNNTFRAACDCYWPSSNYYNICNEEIPGLKNIISLDEIVSSEYSLKIKILLNHLSVHKLCFTDIYKKYCENLTQIENIKWFFDKLMHYWKVYKEIAEENEILKYLQNKFTSSSCLLSKNGIIYSSTELYSSRFVTICKIVEECDLPFLDYEDLTGDLEKFLGFKNNLDLKDIQQLTKAFDNKQELGERKTRLFFTTVLYELKKKDINEIKKYSFSLLNQENKVKPAKNLYYFEEEGAKCYLSSCYLKQILGMTHGETLELAKLCGVNVLPFDYDIKFGQNDKIDDLSLKEFYLERLPAIAFQESRERNESSKKILNDLYEKVHLIELYKCCVIYVQYAFGNPIETRNHFDNLKLYVVNSWRKQQTKIHKHLREKLCLVTNIGDILDMDPSDQTDLEDWLHFQEESTIFYSIQKEFQELLTKERE